MGGEVEHLVPDAVIRLTFYLGFPCASFTLMPFSGYCSASEKMTKWIPSRYISPRITKLRAISVLWY